MIRIGVLGIQGDVHENILAVKASATKLGIECTVHTVNTSADLAQVDGLVIPGGESTTIGKMSIDNGLYQDIKQRINGDLPVLGICAGMVLLSKSVSDHTVGITDQPLLDILDVQLERNSFGRQRDSFEATISLDEINIPQFNGIFIRAPSISGVGSDVTVLSKLDDKIVAVKRGKIIGTAFHPELTRDTSIHEYFLKLVAG